MKILIPSLELGDELLDWAMKQEAQPLPKSIWVSTSHEVGVLFPIQPIQVPILECEPEIWYRCDFSDFSSVPDAVIVMRYKAGGSIIPQMSGVYKAKCK